MRPRGVNCSLVFTEHLGILCASFHAVHRETVRPKLVSCRVRLGQKKGKPRMIVTDRVHPAEPKGWACPRAAAE